ncbi:hypothetical protein SAMN04488525_102514 [Trichococcus collinsii]|uniref:Uncharacterized protein n=1 Tax=Trichococcus collinsii TaxID=157076 RepID=A0AB37ZZC1_9LACT|nr:hypothetical protein SAMN04488525_102514 [Trichococcus collinsii]
MAFNRNSVKLKIENRYAAIRAKAGYGVRKDSICKRKKRK